jgi:acetyl esterase/lipase
MHTAALYEHFAQQLANRLGAHLFLPNDSLAPEHRYPAGTDDSAFLRANADHDT